MRRMVFLLAVAALALLMEAGLARAQAAVGDSAAATGTAEDPFLATGQIGCCQYRFTIAAHSGPSGESPGGSVAVQFLGRDLLPYSFSGHVSCLAVSGKQAAIGVIVDQSEGLPAPAVGQAVTLFAADNHAPVTGTLFGGAPPDADRLEVDLTSSGCPAFPPASNALYYVYNGDIVIHDAIPVPTSKDQCKNGGWRNFPGFTNQGDCIRFVTHQARQACIFERAAIGRPAFRAKYGDGKQHRHALRNCARQRVSG